MTKAKTKEADTGLFTTLPADAKAGDVVVVKGSTAKQPSKAVAIPTRQASKTAAARVVPMTDPTQIMALIADVAKTPGIDPDRLDKLLALQERIMDRNAKAAFDQAMAQMQPHLPVIDRKGRIIVREKDKNTGERTGKELQNTPYAKWEDINEAMTPVLSQFGFAQTFRVEGGAGSTVAVTTILSHEAGHREQTTIILPHDSTGSKNSVQAIGSAISYGKRYGSGALLNFTTRGEDDDGKTAGGGPVVVGDPLTDEEFMQLNELIEAAGAPKDGDGGLIAYLNRTRPKNHPVLAKLNDLPRSRFKEAVDVVTAWEARKKERETMKK